METNNVSQNNKMHLTGHNYASVDSIAHNQPTKKQEYQHSTDTQYIPTNRLNGLDSTILEKEAYRDINDDTFKIEYKIEQLETEISILDKQIASANELNDITRADTLTLKKHSIENRLKELYVIYNNSDISRKLTGSITSLVSPKTNVISRIKDNTVNFLSRKVLPKISRRFSSGQDLKTALNKLETINKNVDELVTLQVPYGEAEEKYEQLTNYLTKANTIQYQVSKELSKKDSRIKKNPFATQTSREESKAMESKTDKKDIAQKNALNLNNNLK